MKQNKYITIFSIFNFSKKRRKQDMSSLKYIFTVIFGIYIITSLLAIFLEERFVVDIFIKLGEILSIVASILISIIAINISNLYNEEIMNLLNGIKEANQPLGFHVMESKIESNIIKILFIIDLFLICGLFLLITIFQMLGLCVETTVCLDNTIRISTFFLNILIISLNILSIVDCIKSSNEYKKMIVEIEKINVKLFDMYNKNLVDSLNKNSEEIITN